MFKIEKGVERKTQRQAKYEYPFQDMQADDSFLIEFPEETAGQKEAESQFINRRRTHVYNSAKRVGCKCSTRVEDKGLRVFMDEPLESKPEPKTKPKSGRRVKK